MRSCVHILFIQSLLQDASQTHNALNEATHYTQKKTRIINTSLKLD